MKNSTDNKINQLNCNCDELKKGDVITITFKCSMWGDTKSTLNVKCRNKVKNGTIDKITFINVNNPTGVKFYAYKRPTGPWGFAIGNSPISNVIFIDSY